MQVVIDIPEEEYRCVQITGHIGNTTQVSNAIFEGTLLDDVKAEIADLPNYMFEVYELKSRVLHILDNIGKECI